VENAYLGKSAYVFKPGNLKMRWLDPLVAKFKEAIAKYPVGLPAKAEEFSDGMVSTLEGRFIYDTPFAKTKSVKTAVNQYRNYIELLFVATSDRDDTRNHCF
jgi:hypothetical protein